MLPLEFSPNFCGNSQASSGSNCANQESCYCNANGDVCIVGNDCRSGNAMVNRKPICDSNWDISDARTICNELGFPKIESKEKSGSL